MLAHSRDSSIPASRQAFRTSRWFGVCPSQTKLRVPLQRGELQLLLEGQADPGPVLGTQCGSA